MDLAVVSNSCALDFAIFLSKEIQPGKSTDNVRRNWYSWKRKFNILEKVCCPCLLFLDTSIFCYTIYSTLLIILVTRCEMITGFHKHYSNYGQGKRTDTVLNIIDGALEGIYALITTRQYDYILSYRVRSSQLYQHHRCYLLVFVF